jgi:metal-responsive CopG/Arc/MetJ family transcriptional regulator
MKTIRINIDLPEEVAKQMNVIAAIAGRDRKNYIQDLVTEHAKKRKSK